MPDEERARKAVREAERHLNAWHGGPGSRGRLLELAEQTGEDERFDRYGAGERIERLERRVAGLLGKEAAVFMPSGTMAQPIAMRIWSERRGIRTVAFHPTCHLERIREPVAALLLELPQRELDKGLGGMAGAALAGDATLVAEARVWQRRHGGNLVTMHPYVVAAEMALETRLERMPVHAAHARALAAALAEVDGVEVVPHPPQTPLFHLLLRGDRERLAGAALEIAEERTVFLFADPSSTTSPSWQKLEVMVGEVTLALEPAEVAGLFTEVLARAAAPPRRRRPTKRPSRATRTR